MMDYGADKRKKNYMLMRSIMDVGMGMVIAGFGVFFYFSKKMGFEFMVDDMVRYLFAGLCLLYGGFRIYRGIAKNYFRRDD